MDQALHFPYVKSGSEFREICWSLSVLQAQFLTRGANEWENHGHDLNATLSEQRFLGPAIKKFERTPKQSLNLRS